MWKLRCTRNVSGRILSGKVNMPKASPIKTMYIKVSGVGFSGLERNGIEKDNVIVGGIYNAAGCGKSPSTSSMPETGEGHDSGGS